MMLPTSGLANQNILPADDDPDDCFLFEDAVKELKLSVGLSFVPNGEQLMQLLKRNDAPLPDLIFLDLNMPRKNGMACLVEIKQNPKLKHLSVVVYSTAFQPSVVDHLYNYGAGYYIRKPNDFSGIKKVIQRVITLTLSAQFLQPLRESFVLSTESAIDEIK